jgi:hypothetical protein
MNKQPASFSKIELKKFGLIYGNSVPAEKPAVVRYVAPFVTCSTCGEKWPLPAAKNTVNLPADWWVFKNGCNVPEKETPTTAAPKAT